MVLTPKSGPLDSRRIEPIQLVKERAQMVMNRYRPESSQNSDSLRNCKARGWAAANSIHQIGVSEVVYYILPKEYHGMASYQLKLL